MKFNLKDFFHKAEKVLNDEEKILNVLRVIRGITQVVKEELNRNDANSGGTGTEKTD